MGPPRRGKGFKLDLLCGVLTELSVSVIKLICSFRAFGSVNSGYLLVHELPIFGCLDQKLQIYTSW